MLSVGAGVPLSTSVALALHTQRDGHAAAAPAAPQQHAAASLAAAQPSTAVLQGALDEITSLKSQISGMEAAVTLISRASSSSPVSGSRHSPAHGRRAAPRQQGQQQQGTASSTASIKATLRSSTQQLPVASGKLLGTKPSSPYAGSPAAAVAGSHRQQEERASGSSSTAGAGVGQLPPTAAWLISTAAAAASSYSEAQPEASAVGRRGGARSCSPGASDCMCEDDMQAVIKVRCCRACACRTGVVVLVM